LILRGEIKKNRRAFVIRLVARGIIEGSKRPFFSHLADPSQQVYFILQAGAEKYFLHTPYSTIRLNLSYNPMANTSPRSSSTDGPVLLFDGVCNLCNGTVQFLLRIDRRATLRFATLQSEIGTQLLQEAGYQGPPLDSVVLIANGRLSTHSDAVLETARLLGFPWSLAYGFKAVPRAIRDALYRRVARNRYAWFGKRAQCLLPTPDLKARFL
jgi:predicted DCC family thiol-disulfide oxidoreductase YuxK